MASQTWTPVPYVDPSPRPKRGRWIAALIVVVAVAFLAVFAASHTTATIAGTPVPNKTITIEPPTQAPAPAPAPAPVQHTPITARQWQEIAKDPAAHQGQAIIVYGKVTQFDAATGNDGFRADVDGVKHAEAYEYPTNSVFVGSKDALASVVQGDQFVAQVTVIGPYGYDTQIGGHTTAPALRVDAISVTG